MWSLELYGVCPFPCCLLAGAGLVGSLLTYGVWQFLCGTKPFPCIVDPPTSHLPLPPPALFHLLGLGWHLSWATAGEGPGQGLSSSSMQPSAVPGLSPLLLMGHPHPEGPCLTLPLLRASSFTQTLQRGHGPCLFQPLQAVILPSLPSSVGQKLPAVAVQSAGSGG